MTNHQRRRNALKTNTNIRRTIRALKNGVRRGRRLTTKEKLEVYDRLIADMEAKAKEAGYTAYLEDCDEDEKED